MTEDGTDRICPDCGQEYVKRRIICEHDAGNQREDGKPVVEFRHSTSSSSARCVVLFENLRVDSSNQDQQERNNRSEDTGTDREGDR